MGIFKLLINKRTLSKLQKLVLGFIVTAVVAANGFSTTSAIAVMALLALTVKQTELEEREEAAPSGKSKVKSQKSKVRSQETGVGFAVACTGEEGVGGEKTSSTSPTSPASSESAPDCVTKVYRQLELRHILASLLANGSILVAGEEGSGKSFLATSVVKQLTHDGFTVAFVEPASTKQMLKDIAEQLSVPTYSVEGKNLTIDELKNAITSHLKNTTAFIVIDDAHQTDLKFRTWLKQLVKHQIPMLILAKDPPRNDIFIAIPRITLKPLPEYAIRALMETAALAKGIHLKNSDLARLQERAGGNPMLAMRAIDEEYLGLEMEGADHQRYFDITPFILLAGIIFVIFRFVGLGTGNQALYIISGIGAVVFLGVSRLLYNLPKETKKIK
jgi:hypothetical protein